MKKNSFLTVDVEEDFEGVGYAKQNGRRNPLEVARLLENICDIFDRFEMKATLFFVVNAIRGQEELLKKLEKKGHEIALHGLDHVPLDLQTPQGFKRSLLEAKKYLEGAVSKPVTGFRAPTWSLKKESSWAVDILKEAGFTYSSSLFPRATGLYGDSSFPLKPFRYPNGLLEIPAQIGNFLGARVPYLGGAYLRALPFFVIHFLLKQDQNLLKMFYVHPWEFKVKRDVLFESMISAFIGKVGLGTTKKKMEQILPSLKKNGNILTLDAFAKQLSSVESLNPFL